MLSSAAANTKSMTCDMLMYPNQICGDSPLLHVLPFAYCPSPMPYNILPMAYCLSSIATSSPLTSLSCSQDFSCQCGGKDFGFEGHTDFQILSISSSGTNLPSSASWKSKPTCNTTGSDAPALASSHRNAHWLPRPPTKGPDLESE